MSEQLLVLVRARLEGFLGVALDVEQTPDIMGHETTFKAFWGPPEPLGFDDALLRSMINELVVGLTINNRDVVDSFVLHLAKSVSLEGHYFLSVRFPAWWVGLYYEAPAVSQAGERHDSQAGESPAPAAGASDPAAELAVEEPIELTELPPEVEQVICLLRVLHSLGHSESCLHSVCVTARAYLAEEEVLDLVYRYPLRYGVKPEAWRFGHKSFDMLGLRCAHGQLVYEPCKHCEGLWVAGVSSCPIVPVVRPEPAKEDLLEKKRE